MKCDYQYCIHNHDGICTLEEAEITINTFAMCDQCAVLFSPEPENAPPSHQKGRAE